MLLPPIEKVDTIEACEAASFLLAHAIFEGPAAAAAAFGSRPNFIDEQPLQTFSPWSREEIAELAGFFPWEGLEESISKGFCGTSAGFKNGEPRVKVYVTKDGSDWLFRALDRFSPSQTVDIDPVLMKSPAKFAGTCRGGGKVGPESVDVEGTLGAWLKCKKNGQYVGISNNHVLSMFGRFPVGHSVLHYDGSSDQSGKGKSKVIGEIGGVVDLVPEAAQGSKKKVVSNQVDLAWVVPSSPSCFSNKIGDPGHLPKGEVDLLWMEREWRASRPISAKLVGAKSGKIVGKLSNYRGITFLRGENGGLYEFEDQLEFDMDDIQEGDSGSLVLSKNNEIIGLFFAILDTYEGKMAIVSPWNHVKNSSGLVFSYT
jgi:hypothetical protein